MKYGKTCKAVRAGEKQIEEMEKAKRGEHEYMIICDDHQKSYFSRLSGNEDFKFVLSETAFEELTTDKIAAYKYIIVFAELQWQDREYIDFYGIDIAVLLRLKLKALAPVCILSFFPKDHIVRNTEIKYNILKARGTCFRQLPVNFDDIENTVSSVIPLSMATLQYLDTFLIDILHIIDVLRHNLRMEMDNSKICNSLKKIEYLSSTPIYPKLQELAKEINTAHLDKNAKEFHSSKEKLIEELNIFHSLKDQTGPSSTDNTAKCKVLLLDDDINDLNWTKDALSRYFDVIPFQDALKAKTYIEQDTKNELSAVICDWQLLKPNSAEHQELLGFEVLEFASKKGFYALASLTSTDDVSIQKIDAYFNFHYLPITKDFNMGEALWKIYVPIIQHNIDQVLAVIASLPTGKKWSEDSKNKSYKEQYIEKRNSIDWFSFENEISEQATKLWEYYSKAFDHEERPNIFSLQEQFGLQLDRTLKNLLIIRRLWLALWFNKTKFDSYFQISYSKYSKKIKPAKPDALDDPYFQINYSKHSRKNPTETEPDVVPKCFDDPVLSIYSVLKRRYFPEICDDNHDVDNEKTYEDLKNCAKQLVNDLCIKWEKLPSGILPEEKAWLQSLKIDITHNANLYEDDYL